MLCICSLVMPVVEGKDAEFEGVLQVARLMCVAARTAPKAKGVDNIVTAVVYGEELEKLASEMEKLAGELGYKFFIRDADNVRKSQAVVLIGLKDAKPIGLNCGACGFDCKSIESMKKEGKCYLAPICAMQLLNLGIALGSAAKVAADHNVDNRMMFSIGVAARRLRLIDADVVIGIPLAAAGKNPYFDRPPLEKYLEKVKRG